TPGPPAGKSSAAAGAESNRKARDPADGSPRARPADGRAEESASGRNGGTADNSDRAAHPASSRPRSRPDPNATVPDRPGRSRWPVADALPDGVRDRPPPGAAAG